MRLRRRPEATTEHWRGRLRVDRPSRRFSFAAYNSYLKALGAGVLELLVVLLVSFGTDSIRPLELASSVVVIGVAIVAIVFIATPLRNRAGNTYLGSMSDLPMGEYHESVMAVGLKVILHALAFAAPSIAALAVLFFTRY